MADNCYFCKKKVGLFGKLSSKKVEEQTVCGDCVNKVKRIAALYDRDFSEYPLKDMGVLIENAASFDAYLSGYEKIREEYINKVKTYKKLLEKDKKDLSEAEKDGKKCEEEYKKDWEEAQREWKLEQASADYKELVREYEKARRRGDSVAMRTTKSLLDDIQNHREEEFLAMKKAEESNNDKLQEMIEWIKIDIDNDERIINMLETYCAVKQYVYRATEVPSESLVLGHTLERQEKENLGKNHIKWYLSKILGINDTQLEDAESGNLILARFGKKLVESNVEDTFKNYYQNKTNIEVMKHQLNFSIMLYQGAEDPQDISKYQHDIEKLNQELEGCEMKKTKIDNEFQIKEAELKAEFLELKERMISAQKVVRESPDKQEESLIGNIAEVQTVNQEKEAPIKDTAQITAAVESYSQEKKISCGHCGKENKVGAKFCKFCGYQLVEEKVRFCTECGNKIKPGKKFCSACGAKVED